jgi:hypothetical protein
MKIWKCIFLSVDVVSDVVVVDVVNDVVVVDVVNDVVVVDVVDADDSLKMFFISIYLQLIPI